MTYRVKCDGCDIETVIHDAPGWFKLEALNPYATTNRGGTDVVTIHLCPVCTVAVKHDVRAAREHHAPVTCRAKPDHPHFGCDWVWDGDSSDDRCPMCGVQGEIHSYGGTE